MNDQRTYKTHTPFYIEASASYHGSSLITLDIRRISSAALFNSEFDCRTDTGFYEIAAVLLFEHIPAYSA